MTFTRSYEEVVKIVDEAKSSTVGGFGWETCGMFPVIFWYTLEITTNMMTFVKLVPTSSSYFRNQTSLRICLRCLEEVKHYCILSWCFIFPISIYVERHSSNKFSQSPSTNPHFIWTKMRSKLRIFTKNPPRCWLEIFPGNFPPAFWLYSNNPPASSLSRKLQGSPHFGSFQAPFKRCPPQVPPRKKKLHCR